jgi:DNA polymerase
VIEVTLASEADFSAWRDQARGLLAGGRPPEQVLWRVEAAPADLFAADSEETAPGAPGASVAASPAVPRRFVEAAKSAICHRDPERFALFYAILWRIVRGGERHVLAAAPDPQVRRLAAMTQGVRRDIHKMKAFVRFREINGAAGEPVYIAWFEPEHHILASTAPFFAERFASMRWSILTPEASAHWDLDRLSFGPGASKRDVPSEDALEEYWRTYYASIFNPARLNTQAMKSQMPVKYWKNLPEASLIAPLAAAAGGRADAMVAAPPSLPPARAAKVAAGARSAGPSAAEEGMAIPDLARLKAEASGCRRCPLWEPATQTVFGEGPADAALMLVGEQPGDKEDLAGRPFVGPAGAVLDRALAEAGIDRNGVYVSNAVKHFKFLIRGTRRLHQKPSVFEIDTCRYWLDAELEAVAPKLVVAMGATAGRGVFARQVKIGRERGRVIEFRQGQRALLTVHPSYLLRLPDQEAKDREYARFVDDLRVAREALAA